MANPQRCTHASGSGCPEFWPFAAIVVTVLLGCSAAKSQAPAVPVPKTAALPVQARTRIDVTQGRPAESSDQKPIPAAQAATAPAPAQTSADATSADAASAAIPKAPDVSAQAAAEAALPPGEKFDENNSAHRLARCRTHVARSEWFDAIGDCRKAAELAPKSVEPHVELMRIYVTIQSYADGADAARTVLAHDPVSAPAYYYLGWALSGGQDYPASIDAFQHAVSIDPKRVEYHQGLGITYCQADNFGKGIAALEEAQRLSPDNVKTRDLLSETRSLLDERLAPHKKEVEARPADPATHAMLGSKLQQYGFAERALAEYDSALAKFPSPIAGQDDDTRRLAAELYYNRGVLYRELGRGELATPAFAKSFEIDPSLAAQAWYFIGLIAYDKGETEAAIRALNKSVQDAPKVVENRKALALAYDKAGRTTAAREQRNAISQLELEAAAAATEPQLAEPASDTGNAPVQLQPEPRVAPLPSSQNQDPADDSADTPRDNQ